MHEKLGKCHENALKIRYWVVSKCRLKKKNFLFFVDAFKSNTVIVIFFPLSTSRLFFNKNALLF